MTDLIAKLDVREMRILLIAVGAVATLAMFFVAVLPQTQQLRKASAETRSSAAIAVGQTDLTAQVAEQEQMIASIRQRLHGDMMNLPIRQVESYVIGRLQRVSWHNSVELVSVEPGVGERIQAFQEVSFNVELIGHYEDLYQWLLEARNELGFFVVKEFALRRNDAADSEPRLLATLSLASYRVIE